VSIITSRSAQGDDCNQKYPESDVTLRLKKAEYQTCNLDVMVKDYGDLLKDQQKLLSALRTSYIRKLEKEYEETKRKRHLDLYDDKLKEIKTSIENSYPALISSASTEAQNGAQQARLKALRKQLKQSKEASQALKTKITWAKGDTTAAEHAEFCKVDFFFRLGEELNSKIVSCLD
jgi:hypothetical protein